MKRCGHVLSVLVVSGLTAAALSLVGCSANPLLLRQQGKQAMDQGHYTAAAAKFHQALKLNPTDDKALYYQGLTLLKLDHPLEAQLTLEKALVLEPEHNALIAPILDHIAEAIYQQHKPKELRSFLAKQVQQRQGISDYIRQGKYLARIGDMDNARLAYRKAAYFAPRGDARPYMAIARFYESIHDVPNAKKAWRYAYYVNPNDPRIVAALQRYNIVPGPTAKLEPPKPAMLTGK